MASAVLASSRCSAPPLQTTPLLQQQQEQDQDRQQQREDISQQNVGDSFKAVIYNKDKTLCRHLVKEDMENEVSKACHVQPSSQCQSVRANGTALACTVGSSFAVNNKKTKKKPKKNATQVANHPPPEYEEGSANLDDSTATAASEPVVSGYCESCASRRATGAPSTAGKPNCKVAPAPPPPVPSTSVPPIVRGAGASAQARSRASKRKKGGGGGSSSAAGNKGASRKQQQRQQQQLRQQRLANLKRAAERKSLFSDALWRDDSAEERAKLREFWMQLGEDDRKRLVQIEREAVLIFFRKMKERQKQACSCAGCVRKRNWVELELERVYGTYYRELEFYANPQQSSLQQDRERHIPAVDCTNKPQGHLKKYAQPRQHRQHSHPPQTQKKVASQPAVVDARPVQPNDVPLPADGVSEDSAFGSDYGPTDFEDSDIEDSDYEESEYEEGEGEEDEEECVDGEEDEEDQEDGELDDEEFANSEEDANDGRYDGDTPVEGTSAAPARTGAHPRARRSAPAPVMREWAYQTKENAHHHDFGRSLTVKDGVLTVVDDLLRNGSERFFEIMERVAERRVRCEGEIVAERSPPAPSGYSCDAGEPKQDEEEDEEDEMSSGEDDDEDSLADAQRLIESRRMFQVFAARMFEQSILTAYREKVAQERQRRLLEELEEENRLKCQREEAKMKQKERKKDKRRAIRQQKEEERMAKEAARKAEEAAARAEKERKEELERQRREEERVRAEQERLRKEEESMKKEEEKRRRAKEREEKERRKREGKDGSQREVSEELNRCEKVSEEEGVAKHENRRKEKAMREAQQKENDQVDLTDFQPVPRSGRRKSLVNERPQQVAEQQLPPHKTSRRQQRSLPQTRLERSAPSVFPSYLRQPVRPCSSPPTKAVGNPVCREQLHGRPNSGPHTRTAGFTPLIFGHPHAPAGGPTGKLPPPTYRPSGHPIPAQPRSVSAARPLGANSRSTCGPRPGPPPVVVMPTQDIWPKGHPDVVNPLPGQENVQPAQAPGVRPGAAHGTPISGDVSSGDQVPSCAKLSSPTRCLYLGGGKGLGVNVTQGPSMSPILSDARRTARAPGTLAKAVRRPAPIARPRASPDSASSPLVTALVDRSPQCTGIGDWQSPSSPSAGALPGGELGSSATTLLRLTLGKPTPDVLAAEPGSVFASLFSSPAVAPLHQPVSYPLFGSPANQACRGEQVAGYQLQPQYQLQQRGMVLQGMSAVHPPYPSFFHSPPLQQLDALPLAQPQGPQEPIAVVANGTSPFTTPTASVWGPAATAQGNRLRLHGMPEFVDGDDVLGRPSFAIVDQDAESVDLSVPVIRPISGPDGSGGASGEPANGDGGWERHASAVPAAAFA